MPELIQCEHQVTRIKLTPRLIDKATEWLDPTTPSIDRDRIERDLLAEVANGQANSDERLAISAAKQLQGEFKQWLGRFPDATWEQAFAAMIDHYRNLPVGTASAW